MIQKQNQKKPQVNSEIEKLKKELVELKIQTENYKNKYLRALADYQNYEKRTEEERESLRQSANKNLILKLLTILDNLEKAEIFIKDTGLKLIKEKFQQILNEEGLEELQLVGKEFNPNFAEAIELVEGKDDNIIKEVIRKGYLYKGKVLRVAQVKVTRRLAGHPEERSDEGSH